MYREKGRKGITCPSSRGRWQFDSCSEAINGFYSSWMTNFSKLQLVMSESTLHANWISRSFDRSGGNLNLHIVCLFLFQSISSQLLFTFHFILDPSLFKLLHINSNFFMCNVIKNSKQLKVKKFRMYTQLVTFTFKNNSHSNKNLLLLMCSNLCILQV